AMFTTRPQPRASIPGRNAWTHRNGPVAFAVRIRCQSSSVVFCTDAEWLIPALFTRMSTWPSRVSASRARVRTPSGSATSQGPARLLEARVPGADRPAERAGVGGQGASHRLTYQLGARRQHDRALVPARVAGAAPELVREPDGPGFFRHVGEHDPRAVRAPN